MNMKFKTLCNENRNTTIQMKNRVKKQKARQKIYNGLVNLDLRPRIFQQKFTKSSSASTPN